MAFQAVPDTVEVVIVYTQNLEALTNIFHAEKPGGYILSDLVGLAAAVDSLVSTELLPVMSNDCFYTRTEIRGLASENDLSALNEDSGGPGTVVSGGNPNNVTLSIKKGSGLTGRSARGRWYAVGTPRTMLTTNENTFIAEDVDDWVAAIEGLRAGIVLTAFTPVIVSRWSAGVLREFGETFDWLTVVANNNFVDTQRRRLTR